MTVREAFYDLTKKLFADEMCAPVLYPDRDRDPVGFHRYAPYFIARLILDERPWEEQVVPTELKFLRKVRNSDKYDLDKEVENYFCRVADCPPDPDWTRVLQKLQFVCVYGNKYLVWDIHERILIEYNI